MFWDARKTPRVRDMDSNGLSHDHPINGTNGHPKELQHRQLEAACAKTHGKSVQHIVYDSGQSV